MGNVLTNREKLILNYLNHNEYVTANTLADQLSVTSRTIKSDITKLKDLLNDKQEFLISVPGKGFKLNHEIKTISNQRSYIEDKDLILNNYDRIAAIIHELLLSDDYIKYELLADKLFISPSTLQRDMRTVRKLLKQFNVAITFKSSYGSAIRGKEFDIRAAISFFFFDSFWSTISLKKQETYSENNQTYKKVKAVVDQLIDTYQVMVSEKYVKSLTSKVIITFERVAYESNFDEPEMFFDPKSRAFTYELIDSVGEIFQGIQLSEKSIDYLYRFVVSNLNISYHPVLSREETIGIMKKIIEEIYQNFDIDFSKNKVLLDKLKTFVEDCYKRTKNKTSVYSSYSLRYFRNYLLATKMTISAVHVIEEHLLNERLPIHEYGDLVLLFQYALDLFNKDKNKIALFTGNDEAEKLLYLNRLRDFLDQNKYEINYVDKLSELKNEEVVLSTISLDKITTSYHRPDKTIICKDFTQQNLEKMMSSLEDLELGKQSRALDQYLTENSILKTSSTSKARIQSLIKNHLQKNGYLKEDVDAPLFYTELGNSIVNIQDLNKIMKEPIVLFVFLKKPIVWNRTVIDTLFLIKTKKDGDSDLHFLCDLFSTFANNPSKIKEIHTNKELTAIKSILIDSKRI